MRIHKKKEEAKKAVEEYVNTVNELIERLGVSDECDDSCAICIVSAKYKTKSGDIETYYY